MKIGVEKGIPTGLLFIQIRWAHPTFANVRVISTSVGIHTEAIYLDSRLHGNDRSTKLQHEVLQFRDAPDQIGIFVSDRVALRLYSGLRLVAYHIWFFHKSYS